MLVGLIKAEQLTQTQRLNTETGEFVEDQELVQWTDEYGPGEMGIIDALTPSNEICQERLWMDAREMDWQMDQFSRTCETKHYDNAAKISQELKLSLPAVKTWELLNKAFSFQRVRIYDFVNDQMTMLEHFEDNLNQNRSNLQNVANFARVCSAVRKNLSEKYHDGELDGPWNHDPRQEALDKYNGN